MQINRGEIWSVAWMSSARKPRPALVIQAEEYRLTETDILALITTTENDADTLRIPIKADESNGYNKIVLFVLTNSCKHREMLWESIR